MGQGILEMHQIVNEGARLAVQIVMFAQANKFAKLAVHHTISTKSYVISNAQMVLLLAQIQMFAKHAILAAANALDYCQLNVLHVNLPFII